MSAWEVSVMGTRRSPLHLALDRMAYNIDTTGFTQPRQAPLTSAPSPPRRRPWPPRAPARGC